MAVVQPRFLGRVAKRWSLCINCGLMAQRLENSPRENIRRTVRLLMKWHGLNGPQLAEMLGCSHQAVYNKLNGHSDFTAPEVDRLAKGFGVDHNLIFGDPDELMRRVTEVIGDAVSVPRRSAARSPAAGSGSSPRRSGWFDDQLAEVA